MNIAYVISAYKFPDQLIRLVQRLSTDTTTFFIHVDRKTADAEFRRMEAGLKGISGVHFLPRHRCDWGGFGHVAATLEGIEAAVTSQTPFDYMILLTGQDYPIKSNEEIDAFLGASAGVNFIAHFPLPTDQWEHCGMDRIENWHVRLRGRRFVIPGRLPLPIRRKIPGGLQPYGGSSYWCLSREAILHIHDFVQQDAQFVDFFRFVDVPDELFFQTILLNSSHRDWVVNDDLRYIVWSDPDAGSPSILTARDFPGIVRSPNLFARKFDPNVDEEVLDLIDQRFLNTFPASASLRIEVNGASRGTQRGQ